MASLARTAARCTLLVVLASVLAGSSCTWSFHSGGDDDDDPPDDGGTIIIVEEATFGGWDLATALADRPGVSSVTRGWNGGALPFLGSGWAEWTGHRRVVRVRFDATQVPFAELVTAARAARADSPRVTVYAHSEQQRADARSVFPAESRPRLRLRAAGSFTPAHAEPVPND